MFGFLRRQPTYVNGEFSDLSLMLTQHRENPTYRHALLDESTLDFSVESLKHIDAYLETLHSAPPQEEDVARVVLRCGAYVGEVIRRNSADKWNWITFAEAAKYSSYAKGLGHSVATTGIF